MFLAVGNKPENPQETHAGTRRTCRIWLRSSGSTQDQPRNSEASPALMVLEISYVSEGKIMLCSNSSCLQWRNQTNLPQQELFLSSKSVKWSPVRPHHSLRKRVPQKFFRYWNVFCVPVGLYLETSMIGKKSRTLASTVLTSASACSPNFTSLTS